MCFYCSEITIIFQLNNINIFILHRKPSILAIKRCINARLRKGLDCTSFRFTNTFIYLLIKVIKEYPNLLRVIYTVTS